MQQGDLGIVRLHDKRIAGWRLWSKEGHCAL